MPTRRTCLATVATAGVSALAGCGFLNGSPPDVVVFNETDEGRTVDVTVTDADTEETVLSESTTVGGGGAAEYPDVLPESGTFELAVAVEGGESGSETWSVESEADSLQAVVSGDGLTFRKR